MPTILKVDGWRFFFFSDEHSPQHIHIEKADAYARIELITLKVTDSYNLNSKELKKLLSLVKLNNEELQKAWNEYFKQKNID
ncbi:MAG: DUF4160 domain-containing protein [Helicobacteraceae bacterium]|nr:DUF4160 domain-containing protein [Helicobacteraceae bacterium]